LMDCMVAASTRPMRAPISACSRPFGETNWIMQSSSSISQCY